MSLDVSRVEAVYLAGRIVRVAMAAVEASRRAARESYTVMRVRMVQQELSHLSLAGRLRALGAVTTIAAVTALVLNAFKPIPIGPLSWALPATSAAVGALVVCFAESVSCAIVDRRAGRVQSKNS